VRAFDGATGAELRSFFAFDPSFRGGVRVAAADLNGSDLAEVVVGAGPGGAPEVVAFGGATGAEVGSLEALDPGFPGGVAVAATPIQTRVVDPR
jgi:hypothetical protein